MEISESPPAVGIEQRGAKLEQLLRLSLCVWVVMLAVYQFSENTVDPDLWGHVVFGQQMLKTGTVERTESYSWTANGQSFINHEYGADLILGGTHLLAGGTGLLLLKMGVGLLTFLLALRMGSKSLTWPVSAIAWVVAAVAVVEISFGFAARPQIFTCLGLVFLLMLLRRIHDGAVHWALVLPPLFAIWINIHGGVLAGVGLLLLAAGATTVEWIWNRYLAQREPADGARTFLSAASPEHSTIQVGSRAASQSDIAESEQHKSGPLCGLDRNVRAPGPAAASRSARTVLALWLACLGVIAALFCNPWGAALPAWLIKSVLWFRPEIQEWNPTPLGWDHATLFFLIAASAFAWAASRRRRALWELAVCGAFAVLALRSVRNAPLFGLVALALVPGHLAGALERFQEHFARLVELGRQTMAQKIAVVLLIASAGGIAMATFTLHKNNPLTMEAPRSSYPVAAAGFMRAHQLKGKTLVFFDWGDFVIFHLPDCPPSIDGRLDACYSRAIIAAHWQLYNGDIVDQSVLPINQADFALLPSKLAGVEALRLRPGWQIAYFDETAVVLAHHPESFPGLNGLRLPIEGPKEASLGRASFADRNLRWNN